MDCRTRAGETFVHCYSDFCDAYKTIPHPPFGISDHNSILYLPSYRPNTKDCGLSFSMADVSKTFKHVNPRKAAGLDGTPCRVLRACADQLAGVFKDIFNFLIPVCCPHMLQDGHHCSCTQEG